MYSGINAFLAAAAMASSLVSASAQADEAIALHQASSHIKVGETAAAQKEWQTARTEFLAATSEDPSDVVALYDLGVAEAHLGELAAAARTELNVLKLKADYVPALNELGCIYSMMGDLTSAEKAERKALSFKPDDKSAAANLDSILAAQRLADQKKATEAPPKKIETARSPGRLVYQPQSIRETKFSAAMDRGQFAFARGHLEIARQEFEQAVLLNPDSSTAHCNLGAVMGGLGHLDREVVEEKRAVDLDPSNASALTNMGWASARKGEWEDALKFYQKALEKKSDIVEAQVGQSLCLFHLGKQEAGIAAVKSAIEQFPAAAAPHLALGTMMREQNRLAEAEVEFKSASRLAPESHEAKEKLAALMSAKRASK
jgi:tetratricopeptide (TPR) repeat protein